MGGVKAEIVRDRIHVWFPYDPRAVSAIKAISGRTFVKEPEPHWTVPLNMSACRRLREAFGRALEIGPDLWLWAAQQRELEASGAALGRVGLAAFSEVSLPVCQERYAPLYNRMKGRPYQLPGASFIASRSGSLLADQPGLGKTVETLGGIVERFGGDGWRQKRILVLAPKTSLRTVWEPEIGTWLPRAQLLVAPEGRDKRNALLSAAVEGPRPEWQFVVINAEMVRVKLPLDESGDTMKGDDGRVLYEPEYPQLFAQPWDAVIVDEGHRYLITSRGQTWHPKMPQVRRGLALLPLAEDGLRVALSGTPWRGEIKNFWGTLNWLFPQQYSSFWTWAGDYLSIEEGYFGSTVGGVRADSRERLEASLPQVMLRRTKSELRQLNDEWAPPDKQYQMVRCEMGAAQRRAYESMKKDAALTIAGKTLTADGVLAEITRLKQLAHCAGSVAEDEAFVPRLPSAKFDQMLEMLAERGIVPSKDARADGALDEVGKVVIASQFTAMLNLYADEFKRLGIDCWLLTGATPERKRYDMVHKFQTEEDGPKLFLLNTTAGGVSITLDAADELWLLDETWIPDDQEQVEDRVHRTSRVDHQVTISYFITLETIEEEIAQITAGRDDTQKQHLDARRGVEFVREWAVRNSKGDGNN